MSEQCQVPLMDSDDTPLLKTLCRRGNSKGLSFKYDKLCSAIILNDTNALTAILNSLTPEEKTKFMNGYFDCQHYVTMVTPEADNNVWRCDDLLEQLSVRYPLSISIVYQSFGCFEILVEQGADLFVQDCRDNNIVHLLIYTAVAKPKTDKSLKFYDHILSKLTTVQQRRRLLLHGSQDGIHPIELAVKFCCSELFRAILYTQGVYREVASQHGAVVRNVFDFSDYLKSETRSCMSILWQLTWVTEDVELGEDLPDILKIPVVKELVRLKFRSAMPFIVFWFLLRVTHGFMYLVVDELISKSYSDYMCINGAARPNLTLQTYYYQYVFSSTHNETIERADFHIVAPLLLLQHYYDFAFAICSLSVDFGESIWLHKRSTMIYTRITNRLMQRNVVNTFFYRLNMILSALNTMIMTAAHITAQNSNDTKTSATIAVCLILHRIFLCVELLYFAQILPFVGFFVIGFQKMLSALLQFALLQAAIIFVYSTLFRHAHVYLCKPDSFSCSYDNSMYETFLIMVDMVDVIDNDCSGVGTAVLEVLHVTYVFVVAVMTINYLVAVMSTVYTTYSYHKQTAIVLHRIHMALLIERRLDIIFSIFPNKFKWGKTSRIEIRELDHDFDGECRNLRLPRQPVVNGIV